MSMVADDMTTHGLRGVLRLDEPMARHTSWRAGGSADRYYEPADLDDLAVFVAGLPADEPLHWVGLGSNLLVRDGGLRGTVIATHGGLDRLELLGPGRVRAEAGVASAKLARFCAGHGLAGAEFLAGIPGTVGGALAMNAGAFGSETWEIVEAVETLDRRGTVRSRRPDEYSVGYRSVSGPADEWFVAGVFRLEPGEAHDGRTRIKSLLERRGASQPIGLPNAGSVFRNPVGDYAARLIEAAGLKGACEGNACVSEMHANFIINCGGATARDIERLIERMRDTVRSRFGIELKREVRIVGEAL
jgi:UDP-N-acetylmuramate dehydrogenase